VLGEQAAQAWVERELAPRVLRLDVDVGCVVVGVRFLAATSSCSSSRLSRRRERPPLRRLDLKAVSERLPRHGARPLAMQTLLQVAPHVRASAGPVSGFPQLAQRRSATW
jgi:hypothetical protein